jgi:tetratricopeptide (TPR) repeat protein
MEEGDLIVHWVNEPLTGEVWLVEEPDTKWVPKDFSYEKLHGKLTISWKLIGQEGDLLAEGTNDYNITRSLGGPLANRRGATVQSPDSLARDALAELCETAASNITEILGPLHAEGDLAPAGDNLSVNARNLVALGNWEEASALWEELLTLNPNYPQALYNLGLFYERKGDLTQAAAYFRRAFLNDQSSRYRNALTRVTAVLRPPDLR